MRTNDHLARIAARIGIDDIVARLADRLPGADFTSLLLAVARRRVARVRPQDVLKQYAHDRFVGTSTIDARALRAVEDAAIAALPVDCGLCVLAPLAPFGAHAAIATVDQNKVVTTMRGSDVAADPTNGLAIEAAARRSAQLFDVRDVDLAATQRVTRAQALPGDARHFAHFQLFGRVIAGRGRSAHAFERDALARVAYWHAMTALAAGAEGVEIRVTPLAQELRDVDAQLAQRLAPLAHVRVLRDDAREGGRGYYRTLCFKTFALYAGEWLEIGDGGDVDWTALLTSNAKERCVIGGLGLDRMAIAAQSIALAPQSSSLLPALASARSSEKSK